MGSDAMVQALLHEFLPWVVGIALAILLLVAGWLYGGRAAHDPEDEANDEPAEGGVFGRLTRPLARMIPDLLEYKSHRDLLRCGYYHPTAYDSYLALRNSLVVGVTLTAACWLVATADVPAASNIVIVAGIAGAILAYSLPRLYLNWRGDRRADRIEVGFPDALDVIVMGLTGGLPLLTALERAGDEIGAAHPDLTSELKIVRRQAEAASLEYSLQRMADRLDIDEVTSLTSTLTHAEQMGAPLAVVLSESADNLRRARMQRAQERGNKTSLKMLFPIVLCLAPATFIVILAPPLMNLKNFRDRETRPGGILDQRRIGPADATARFKSPRPAQRPAPMPRAAKSP